MAAERKANAGTAKVIPLHTDSPRRPADRQPGPRGRHPSAVPLDHVPGASAAAGVTPISDDVRLRLEAELALGERPVDSSPLIDIGTAGVEAAARAVAGRLGDMVGFVRERVTGDYLVDDFGFDEHFTEAVWLPALRVLFEKWFRVEVTGVENLPVEGGALLVANHAGALPVDALMAAVAVHDHHPRGRHLRLLAADLAFAQPVIGDFARKVGATLACTSDAERLLREGELTGVWPEGFKGIGKLYKDRYKLQRFGRGGFVTTALRTGAPIVPVSIVGSEEIYPMLSDLKPIAKLLGLPYVPLTPLFPLFGPLGLVPLPSKWHIHFGEPIDTERHGPGAAEDPMIVFDLTDHVREEIQQTLFRLLSERKGVYF